MAFTRPYDVKIFNQLPSIEDAEHSLHVKNGPVIIKSTLQDLFVKYLVVARSFGVILLHRHFPLRKHEALVDTNGTSTPWNLSNAEESASNSFEKHGGYVKPQSWLFADNSLMPYEFYFDRQIVQGNFDEYPTSDRLDPAFVEEFASVLDLHGLKHVLGLAIMKPGNGGYLEMTEGKANITTQLSGDTEYLLPTTPTMWCYTVAGPRAEDGDGSFVKVGCKVQMKCEREGSGDDATHTSVEGRRK